MSKRSDATTVVAPVKLLLSVDEAAEALSIGRSVVYELVLTRRLPSIKIGRSRRVPVSALEAFVAERLSAE